jgi:hypothetical protein
MERKIEDPLECDCEGTGYISATIGQFGCGFPCYEHRIMSKKYIEAGYCEGCWGKGEDGNKMATNRVNVYSVSIEHDGIEFNYCEECIEVDKNNGFEVEIIDSPNKDNGGTDE